MVERSPRVPLRAWPLLLLALSLIGCSPRPPRGEGGDRLPALAAAQSPPSASVAAAPNAPDGGAPRDRPSRTGAPGSTRGTVACGAARCNAPAEVCVWDEKGFAWACVKPAATAAGESADLQGFACDDGTDCPAGETCCQRWIDVGTPGSVCVRRAEDGACSAELCLPGGARCPPGRTCTSQSPDEPGDCEAPRGPATCAGRRRCPAEAPVCVEHQGKLACAAPGSAIWKEARARWQCTLPSDCNAGDTCFFAFGDDGHEMRTYCGRYTPSYRGTMACDPRGPSPCGKDAACRAAYTCTRDSDDPPWLGGWIFKGGG